MKNVIRLLTLATLATTGAAFGALGTACSSDSTTKDGGTSSTGTTTSTGPTTSTGTTGTATGTTTTPTGTTTGTTPPASLNGCSAYVDRTADAAGREITWDFPVSSTPEACLKIKVGQSVTWKGDFVLHPLASKGGDSPSPITNVATTKFEKAGLFGWVCTAHPRMQGVVQVAP